MLRLRRNIGRYARNLMFLASRKFMNIYRETGTAQGRSGLACCLLQMVRDLYSRCYIIYYVIFDVSGLGNTTNNRIESLNQKLKQAITLNSAMREFFTNLLVVITSMRTERLHVAHSAVMKVVVKYQSINGMEEFERFLTPYAAGLVAKEMKKVDQIKPLSDVDGRLLFAYHGRAVEPSVSSCQCWHFEQLQLPCCHIFVLRKAHGLHGFDLTLCAQRWTRSYYRQVIIVFIDNHLFRLFHSFIYSDYSNLFRLFHSLSLSLSLSGIALSCFGRHFRDLCSAASKGSQNFLPAREILQSGPPWEETRRTGIRGANDKF